jgi:YD repeat-containing protein
VSRLGWSSQVCNYPNKGNTTVFSNATYTPWGAVSSRLLGNGLTETIKYDNRERVTSITQSKLGSTVGYSVSIEQYAPNGNVIVANDSVNGNWIYQYDSLNRLNGASSSSGLNLSWLYDSFGNRWSQSASGSGSAPQPSFTFTGNNNRTDPSNGLDYDAAGNVQIDNLNQSYNYDAEGRISSASLFTGGTATYKYDSEGNLVYESGASGVQVFQRNTAGQPVYIYTPTGASGPYYDYMAYIDGELIGTWQNQSFRFIGKDWLGTKRYESTGVGTVASGFQPLYVNSSRRA